jgi:PAS domain S-box-containing protein
MRRFFGPHDWQCLGRVQAVGYLVAVVATAAAVLLRWLLDPVLGDALPLVTLYGAVAMAVWAGGCRAALLAMALGYLAAHYLFIAPRDSIALKGTGDLVGGLLYLFSCLLLIGFGSGMRAAQRRAQAAARAALEQHRQLADEISARKQAEEALHASEQRCQQVVETVPLGMLLVDQAGRIVLANARIEPLFGYGREEITGQPVEVLVPERFRLQHTRHRAAFSAAPAARPMGVGRDLYGRRKDGSEFPVEVGLTPLPDAAGLHTLASIIDITARKQAEAVLRQAQATLEQQVRERTALVEMMQDITRAANEARSSAEALQYAVDRLCAYAGWPVGHAYLAVSADADRWVPFSAGPPPWRPGSSPPWPCPFWSGQR